MQSEKVMPAVLAQVFQAVLDRVQHVLDCTHTHVTNLELGSYVCTSSANSTNDAMQGVDSTIAIMRVTWYAEGVPEWVAVKVKWSPRQLTMVFVCHPAFFNVNGVVVL